MGEFYGICIVKFRIKKSGNCPIFLLYLEITKVQKCGSANFLGFCFQICFRPK